MTFFKQLSLVSLFTLILMSILHLFPQIAIHCNFSWATCLFFILLSVLIFFIAYFAAYSSNKNAFTAVIMGFVFMKMILSVSFILVFMKIVEPVSHSFLIPFFIVYLIYTIFETYFMTKLAKIKP